MSKIISLSGPSGIGKTTVLKRLKKWNYIRAIPVTTRKRRGNELPDEYRFLSTEEYNGGLKDGKLKFSFFFFDSYYGYFNNDIDSLVIIGGIPILEMYTGAIPEFKRVFPSGYSLFMMSEDIGLLEERMRKRGDDVGSIEKKLKYATQEIEIYHNISDLFDYTVLINRSDSEENVESKLLEGLKYVQKI